MAKHLLAKFLRFLSCSQTCRSNVSTSVADGPSPLAHIRSFSSYSTVVVDSVWYSCPPVPPPPTPKDNQLKKKKSVIRRDNQECCTSEYFSCDSIDLTSHQDEVDQTTATEPEGCNRRDNVGAPNLFMYDHLYNNGCFSTAADFGHKNQVTERLIASPDQISCPLYPMVSDASAELSDEEAELLRNKQNFKSGKTGKVKSLGRPVSKTRREDTACTSEVGQVAVPTSLMSSMAGGKVKESLAVIKMSADPLHDFKTSMVEMVMEKQLFERNDLEELLRCFLSLNSTQHHGIIIEAFSEIWEILCCQSTIEQKKLILEK